MSDRDEAPQKKYQQVRQHLLEMLQSGEFREGEFVGAEQDIIDDLGLSRNTVRRAVGDLVSEGVLYRKRGQGIFFAGFERTDANTSGIIGIITHTLVDNIYPEIIQGIEDTAHNRGYSVALSSTSFDSAKELRAIEHLCTRQIEGLIIEPAFSSQLTHDAPTVAALEKLPIPVVLTNCRFSFLPFSAVTIDDVRLGYRAAEYLITRGHRSIAFVYFRNSLAAAERAAGLHQALRDYGLSPDACIDVPYSTGEEQRPAFEETRSFLARRQGGLPDAVLYYNDQSALDAYPAFREYGVQIGRDVSVMAFDDIGSARLVDPPLSTWAHPKYRLGQWAAGLLFEEMREPREMRIPRTVFAHPPLVERNSVRTLHSGTPVHTATGARV